MGVSAASRQSPTLNAAPVIAATLGAVRRGLEVTLYLDLGYNDAVNPDPSKVRVTRADNMLSVVRLEGRDAAHARYVKQSEQTWPD